MAAPMVSLDDKYTLDSGRVFLTGIQALVRLPLMQRQRDVANGLNTGCFISGYRGSPLGALDQQLWQAKPFIEKNHIHFEPGVNEDLAATAVWGSQQLNLFPAANYDGVFSMWYAKGPGVDRSGDVLRHGNFAGSSKHGGVLLLAGDDHTCKSSTTAHQTEFGFKDAMIPVLNPSGVQEFLDMGIHGWAMSRYSGCWVAFKVVAETADTSASVYVDPVRIKPIIPNDFDMPQDGLNIRWPDEPLAQEERLHRYKLFAALAYARANNLNRAMVDGPNRRFGIVTAGKSYLDVMQALEDLGIDEAYAKEIGLSVYKVGMTWPLEPEGVRRFAEGMEEILVVEEKRALIEEQLKEQLYNWRADLRPRVFGKFDENGEWIMPTFYELTPGLIARAIAKRIERFHNSPRIQERLIRLDAMDKALDGFEPPIKRTPYFCSGCPHNTSTKVPEGSRALAGIGCHYMAQWMDRDTDTSTQMGGEGVTWMGQAPFTSTKHVFANLGDGTYYHSGLLAIRAAVASGANITYKILYNDAVAMTGGQPVGAGLSVPLISHQLFGEGVRRIVVVSDEPEKYSNRSGLAEGVTIEHRDELDRIQKELRQLEGVTAIIYDQTCAAEKRRRRKRGTFPDPVRRVVINELVCEGCGDCSVQSNCLSVVPVETEFGRKRTIDQSSCNKDFSCLKGFCPSLVTVEGGQLRKPKPAAATASSADLFEVLPEPTVPDVDELPYGILITGVGGTGVVTIGALLGMAAHIEGKGCSILDMTGLAQKGGAVLSHVRIAKSPENIHSVRIASGGANLLLGCDLVVAAAPDAISKIATGETTAVINTHKTIVADFTRDPDLSFPLAELERAISDRAGNARTNFIEGTRLATALLGDSIASNMFMLGFAWQKGAVPIGREAIEEAIALNGVAIEANKRAFLWGRRAAHDMATVEKVAAPTAVTAAVQTTALEDIVEKRFAFLRDYQDEAYARRYKDLVVQVQTAEARVVHDDDTLARTVARYYFKLLAYKDEFEVARLYTELGFLDSVASQFEGNYKLNFHLAPPILAERDPETGVARKKAYGRWVLIAFKLLAKLRFLRGGPLDPFNRTTERKRERSLITEYETVIDTLLKQLNANNHPVAVEIAGLPEQIRGYGHVKERHIDAVKARETELLTSYRNPATHADAAD